MNPFWLYNIFHMAWKWLKPPTSFFGHQPHNSFLFFFGYLNLPGCHGYLVRPPMSRGVENPRFQVKKTWNFKDVVDPKTRTFAVSWRGFLGRFSFVQQMGVEPPKNYGKPLKWMVKIMENPIKMDDLIGFSIINHSFWDTPIFWKQIKSVLKSGNCPWKFSSKSPWKKSRASKRKGSFFEASFFLC